MKHLKTYKLFESILVNDEPQLWQVFKHHTDFRDKEFNRELLDTNFINDIKDFLIDLSDMTEISIGFKRTIPNYVKKDFEKLVKEDFIDIMTIDFGLENDLESWEILETTCRTLKSFINHCGLKIYLSDKNIHSDFIEVNYREPESFFKKSRESYRDVILLSIIIF